MRQPFVGDWSNDNQPQKPSGGAASPEDVIEDFVTNPATFRAEINTGLLPIKRLDLRTSSGVKTSAAYLRRDSAGAGKQSRASLRQRASMSTFGMGVLKKV